jgi:hypothetical protein
MYSFSQDIKYLFIDNNALDEHWKLEKNQISFKWVNELVMIDRNGMHYKNIAYTEIIGGFANAQDAVTYLESLVADASINVNGTITVDTTGLATSAKQDTGNNLLTDIKAFFTNTYNQVTNWFAVKVINRVDIEGGNTTAVKVDGSAVTQPISGIISVSNFPATQPISAVSLPLPTGAATSAAQTTTNNYLAALNSLVPSAYDYVSLTYTGDNVTTVVYKLGGSGGSTVSTLTLAYSGDNLTSVTKT